ncbi:MAG: hypothetical protein WBN23_11000 [Woeseia sp.]
MRLFCMTLILLFCSISTGAAPPNAAEAARIECAEVRRQIRRIHSRMRAGYTASQGIRLDDRLRELKKKRARVCR